jgi:puromycin-sensitive aminopeptidase
MAWAYFKENIELLKSKLAKAVPALMDAVIVNSAGVFCTIEHAQEIEDYFNANPIPKSSRRITQLIESIRNSGAMLNKLKESELVNPSFWNA